jgi:hypothetical protein
MSHDEHRMHEHSVRAYLEETDSGAIGARAARILEEYIASPVSLTDREVKTRIGYSDMNSVRPRITELIKAGLLEECGSVRDEVTGKSCRSVRLKVREPKQEALFT